MTQFYLFFGCLVLLIFSIPVLRSLRTIENRLLEREQVFAEKYNIQVPNKLEDKHFSLVTSHVMMIVAVCVLIMGWNLYVMVLSWVVEN